MAIVPKISVPERILVMGSPGCGKSNAMLKVARRNPDNHFYVLDNEGSSFQTLLEEEYQDVLGNGNVTIYPLDANDWEGHIAALKEVKAKMGRGDWVVIDMMTATWGAVQNWFTDQVFNQDIEEYFLEVRKMKKNKAQGESKQKPLAAFEGFMDWSVINPTYQKLYTLLLSMPGNVYATAEVAKIAEEEDRDVNAIFGSYGVKPKGQKRMGHVFSTILLFKKSKVGDYSMTSIKQRGREEFENVKFDDWSLNYLVRYAKWTIEKKEQQDGKAS